MSDATEQLPQCPQCLRCGLPTAQLKQMRIPDRMIFLVLFVRVHEVVETGCPKCVLAFLRRRLLPNIPTTTLAWPALAALYVPRFWATYQPGPTFIRPVANPLVQDVGARPGPRALLRAILVAVECTAAIVFLAVALGARRHTSELAVGWTGFVVCAVLIVLTPRLGRRPAQ